jgi:CheY-like chemotaxis protein
MNILLVDSTPLYRDILQSGLAGDRGFTITYAASVAEAQAIAAREAFNFYILAWQLPDGEGIDLARQLRQSHAKAAEPIILLTGSASAELADQAMRAGASELFRKQDVTELITFIRHFLSVYGPISCRVIYIEDARDQRMALISQMQAWGMQVDAFAVADDAWKALQSSEYDLVVSDVMLGAGMSGSRLISRIRRQPGALGRTLILAATAFDDPSRRIELFHLGVDDYITKPFAPLEFKARVHNLLKRKRALEQNQQLLKATALGVTIINETGVVESLDSNAQRMFSSLTTIPPGTHLAALIPPADDDPGGDLLADLLAGAEINRRRIDGLRNGVNRFPLELTSLDLDGNRHRFALLTRDISDELALARNLTAAKEAAERAGRMKSEFLTNMSHEIRTPLNAILGMTYLIKQDGVSPTQAERLDKVSAAGEHLLDIINAILDLSKIEAGKLTIEETDVNLGAIVTNVRSMLFERATAKKLQLQVEAPPLPGPLRGDPTRIQQALLNYAANAIKFTDQGNIILRVLPEQESEDSVLVRFEVEDQGIGIEPDVLTRLFTTFEQADNSITRKYGGTGLGLVITKKLAHAMGGEAGVNSTPGAGSTFWFTARLKKGGANPVAAPATAQSAELMLRTNYPGRRILLVEDEPVNREIALILLENVGQLVDTANDGVDAVDLASHNHYDLILMDMQMPRMNGLDATRAIRKLNENGAQVPIVAMTANAFAEDRARCMESGMNDFLTKPLNPQGMFSMLLRWYQSAT